LLAAWGQLAASSPREPAFYYRIAPSLRNASIVSANATAPPPSPPKPESERDNWGCVSRSLGLNSNFVTHETIVGKDGGTLDRVNSLSRFFRSEPLPFDKRIDWTTKGAFDKDLESDAVPEEKLYDIFVALGVGLTQRQACLNCNSISEAVHQVGVELGLHGEVRISLRLHDWAMMLMSLLGR